MSLHEFPEMSSILGRMAGSRGFNQAVASIELDKHSVAARTKHRAYFLRVDGSLKIDSADGVEQRIHLDRGTIAASALAARTRENLNEALALQNLLPRVYSDAVAQ